MFRLPVPKNYNNAGDNGALQIMLNAQTVDRDALQYLIDASAVLRPLPVYCWQSSFVATGEQVYAHSSFYFDQLMILWAIAIEQYLLKDYRNAAGTVRFIRDRLLPLVDHYWPFEPLVPRPPEAYRDHYEPVYMYFGALALGDAPMARAACYLRILDLWQNHAFSRVTIGSELAALIVEVYRARFDVISALTVPASQKALQMYALSDELRARGYVETDEKLRLLDTEIASAAYQMKRVGMQTESITATTVAPATVVAACVAPSIGNSDEQAFLAHVYYTRYTPGIRNSRTESS